MSVLVPACRARHAAPASSGRARASAPDHHTDSPLARRTARGASRRLLEARQSGDADAIEAVEEQWAERFENLLSAHAEAEAEAEVRGIIGAFIERSPARTASSTFLHYVNNVAAFQQMDAHWAKCGDRAS